MKIDLLDMDIISLILAIIGVILTIIGFFWKPNRSKILSYYSKSFSLVSSEYQEDFTKLEFYYKNNESSITKVNNLILSKFVICNLGADVIEREDIKKTLKLTLNNCQLLDCKLIYPENENNEYKFKVEPENNQILFKFDYLPKNEGGIIQLAYSGQLNNLELEGRIKNYPPNQFNKLGHDQFSSKIYYIASDDKVIFISCLAFMCICSFLLAVILLDILNVDQLKIVARSIFYVMGIIWIYIICKAKNNRSKLPKQYIAILEQPWKM